MILAKLALALVSASAVAANNNPAPQPYPAYPAPPSPAPPAPAPPAPMPAPAPYPSSNYPSGGNNDYGCQGNDCGNNNYVSPPPSYGPPPMSPPAPAPPAPAPPAPAPPAPAPSGSNNNQMQDCYRTCVNKACNSVGTSITDDNQKISTCICNQQNQYTNVIITECGPCRSLDQTVYTQVVNAPNQCTAASTGGNASVNPFGASGITAGPVNNNTSNDAGKVKVNVAVALAVVAAIFAVVA